MARPRRLASARRDRPARHRRAEDAVARAARRRRRRRGRHRAGAAWTKVVQSAQRLLVSRLALQGVVVHPALSFARVLDGFSAVMPPSVIPLVERDPDVAGVYPVRVAYPATIAARSLTADAADSGDALASAGVDGRGVTVAILDTGRLDGRTSGASSGSTSSEAERRGSSSTGRRWRASSPASLPAHPCCRSASPAGSRMRPGAGRSTRAAIRSSPGSTGPSIRTATATRTTRRGSRSSRSPSRSPASPTGPRRLPSRARATSTRSSSRRPATTAPTAAAYGDISGPGGAPDALTVGALDTRPDEADVHVVVRSGLRTLVDATMPLAGDASPPRVLDLPVVRPLKAFFTRSGGSIVAGRAALLAAGASPGPAAERRPRPAPRRCCSTAGA